MKYLNARVEDTIFDSFNLACADMGESKQHIIQELATIFVEAKEEAENQELLKLAKKRHENYKKTGKTYSFEEIKALAEV